MKTSKQVMDRVRLHTVATVAVLMLAIFFHNINPTFMVPVEAAIIGLWLVNCSAAEHMCESIEVSELLNSDIVSNRQ